MQQLKAIPKRVFILLAVLASSLCFATPALANNHADTGWSMYLSNWNTADTPNRQKQDASSGYILVQTASGNRQVRAWMLGYGNEPVGSQTVKLGPGQWSYVTNYAYEWYGRKQVHMRIQNTANVSGSAAGLWSPDSV